MHNFSAAGRGWKSWKRLAAVVCCVALLLPLSVPSGAADQPKALDWIMNEPVTLFDLGIVRLDQNLSEMARWLRDTEPESGLAWTGAYYQWRERRIIAYLTVREPDVEPTVERCRRLFRRSADWLMTGVPIGEGRAGAYLESLFLHPGLGNWGRPRSLAAELRKTVRYEVTVLPPLPVIVGGPSVRCAGPLDAAADELTVSTTGAG